ncbi:tape measure protein [Metasolibacillus sp.]|uniref:tape measure protein n=1 Tax=Metasolibacillus sp. TaxID=2703680 RepID=UPI0025E581BF|nr:tape measure protein [Metasolibacillus sp.]MCT6924105.1 tape measure protein [Metasolibacillus sp.]MCT6940212.1 tape measure protein [Metasolibacillus sp.]
MATIRTAIQLVDNFSQPMGAMNSAMIASLDFMRQMNKVSGNLIDTSSLEQAQRELVRMSVSLSQIENEIRDADNAQRQFNNKIRDGTNEVDGLIGKIGALIGMYLSLRGIGELVTLSDNFTGTNARIASINDGMQTTQELQQTIFDSAQRTFTPYMQAADTVAKLATNAGHAFSSSNEIVAFTELLNKSFANANTNAEGIASATLQLNQAMGSGVLRGEELNAVLEAAPGIVENIEKYLGISRVQLKKMASDGQITADVVKNAMFAAAEDINTMFDSLPMTWSQIWISFKNEALWAFQSVLNRINAIFNGDRFKEFRANAVQVLKVVGAVASWVFDQIINVGAFIYDNWSLIGPIVFAVIGIIGTLITYLTLARGAIVAITVVQWLWNAAMMANPIFWIIVAIIIFIALLYLAVAAFNKLTGESVSATGLIAAAFMLLGAYVYNSIAYMWNTIAAFVEFFVNVWQHPMYSVKKLFYNLASNVLDQAIAMASGWDGFATSFVNAIIKAVNLAIEAWNWFIDLLPDNIAAEIGLGKGGFFEERKSVVGDMLNLKDKLGEWVEEPPADYWEAPKMDPVDLAAVAKSSYEWGKNLFNPEKEKENGSPVEDAINDALALGDKVKEGNDAAKKTAKNTGKMADGVKFLNDELKYLRDLAEREAINRYTTAEIHIDNRSENHINSELDIDGIVDRFGEKVEEVAEKLAEGAVYDV